MSGPPPQRAASSAGGQSAGEANVKAVRAQLELMEQDCYRAIAPDYTTPFKNLEDAVDRLLPFHMFGAEDPMQTDAREVESAAVPSRLATSRNEAWNDHVMHKVNEYCSALMVLEKQIKKSEKEALQRSQLPALMLQSYATAEMQAVLVAEQGRKARLEREAREKEEAERRAILERQQAADAAAAAAALAQQQQQQALMAQRQQLLLQQQQQAAAAAAAQRQQQQQQGEAPRPQQIQRQQQQPAPQQQQQQHHAGGMQQPLPGLQQGVMPPGMMAPQGGAGMPMRPPGQPPQQPQQQQAGAKLSAAELKAQQLAALKARIGQRK